MLANRIIMGEHAVRYVDDGDTAPTSGTGTSAHTYSSKTSSGPTTLLLITFQATNDRTISSVTFNGNSCTVDVQVQSGNPNKTGAAIAHVTGAQSGDIVVNFSGGVDDSHITIVSLANLNSESPTDTDSDVSNEASSLALAALAAPGGGGIRVFVYSNDSEGGTVSFDIGVRIADLSAGEYRHAAGVHQANSAATITATGHNQECAFVGVSMR